MNIYSLKFTARCPIDQSLITYDWTVCTGGTFMAEELRSVADGIVEGLHERIADDLFDSFGGQQRLKATHAGEVHIETLRPSFVHWARAKSTAQEPGG